MINKFQKQKEIIENNKIIRSKSYLSSSVVKLFKKRTKSARSKKKSSKITKKKQQELYLELFQEKSFQVVLKERIATGLEKKDYLINK